MSLSCAFDEGDGSYVEVEEELLISAASFKCFECHKEFSFSPFHMVRVFRYANDEDYEAGHLDEDDEEITESLKPCCEACADLGSSILEQGYCWSFGEIRNDIADIYGEW